MRHISIINDILDSSLAKKDKRMIAIANDCINRFLKIYAQEKKNIKDIFNEILTDPKLTKFRTTHAYILDAIKFLFTYKQTWETGSKNEKEEATKAFLKLLNIDHVKQETIYSVLEVAKWIKNSSDDTIKKMFSGESVFLDYLLQNNNIDYLQGSLLSMGYFNTEGEKNKAFKTFTKQLDASKISGFFNFIIEKIKEETKEKKVDEPIVYTKEQYEIIKKAIENSANFENIILKNEFLSKLLDKYGNQFQTIHSDLSHQIVSDSSFYNLIVKQHEKYLENPDFVSWIVAYCIVLAWLSKIDKSTDSKQTKEGVVKMAKIMQEAIIKILPNFGEAKSLAELEGLPITSKKAQYIDDFANLLYTHISSKFISAYENVTTKTDFSSPEEEKYIKETLKNVRDNINNNILAFTNKLSEVLGVGASPGQFMFANTTFEHRIGDIDKRNIEDGVSKVVSAIEERGGTIQFQDDKNLNQWLKRDTLLLSSVFFYSLYQHQNKSFYY